MNISKRCAFLVVITTVIGTVMGQEPSQDHIARYLQSANTSCQLADLFSNGLLQGSTTVAEVQPVMERQSQNSEIAFKTAILATTGKNALQAALKKVRVAERTCVEKTTPSPDEPVIAWKVRKGNLAQALEEAIQEVKVEQDVKP